MRQTNVRGTLSLRGFRKLRTGAIVATGVILLGLGFLAPTVSANEQDGVWVARTVAEVKADIQNIDNLSHYTIKWGDTLSAISGATGLSVDSLVEINRIANRDLIFANNKLYFSEEAFLKDGNTEVKRQQVSIANSGSCQSYEVETKTDTVTGEQTTTVKQTTPVVVETPAVSAAKSETPVTVAPKAETRSETLNAPSTESNPVTDKVSSNIGTTNQPVASNPSSEVLAPSVSAPKAEEPTASAPKAEEPAVSAPKADEPVASAPKVEEPAATTPKAEEPSAPAPKVEEPSAPAPKAEEPTTPAPKAEEPVTPTPKVEEPATPSPKAEEPAAPAPKVEDTVASKEDTSAPNADKLTTNQNGDVSNPVDSKDESSTPTPETSTSEPKSAEPTTSAPKNDESGSSVESPSTGNHSEESGTPSETPTGGPTATQPSDTSTELVTPGEASTPAKPAGEADKSEVSNPSPNATNEGDSGASTPVTDNSPSNVGTTNQPVSSNPSSEATAPKVEEPTTSAPKNDESGSSVESPSTGNHSEESGTPSETPTGGPTATQPSDTSTELVTPGEASTPAKPAGEADKSEVSNPSPNATNEGVSGASTPVTDNSPSNAGTTNQSVSSNPSSEATEPKADTPSEEVAPKDEKLEEAKKDGKDIIEKIASSKLSEIEKVKEEAEKTKLKEKLNELKEEALAAINNAKDHDAAVAVADEYQTKIDEIDVPGEELPAPNYNKDNLTNGRNEGTTIDNGSTAIGHGSGEAPTQPATEERSTSTASPTQPASTETTAGTSSFRNAPSVQARARRVARSTSEPDGTVNISYNFAGMPDIHGFLSDPGEDNTVTIPAGTNEEQAKELVKEKIQAKIKDLAARGYYVKNDIIFEQDTTVKNYNYVVTFTKEATGTSGFRMAPAVQPRASRNRRSIEQPAPQKVKVNVFYNFDKMKDIAGFLGDINGTPLEVAEGLTNEEVKVAVKNHVEAKKEELSKRGYTFKEDYVYQSNGKDYNYVVTFSKATK